MACIRRESWINVKILEELNSFVKRVTLNYRKIFKDKNTSLFKNEYLICALQKEKFHSFRQISLFDVRK